MATLCLSFPLKAKKKGRKGPALGDPFLWGVRACPCHGCTGWEEDKKEPFPARSRLLQKHYCYVNYRDVITRLLPITTICILLVLLQITCLT